MGEKKHVCFIIESRKRGKWLWLEEYGVKKLTKEELKFLIKHLEKTKGAE